MHPILTEVTLFGVTRPIGGYGAAVTLGLLVTAIVLGRAAHRARLDVGATIATIGYATMAGFAGAFLLFAVVYVATPVDLVPEAFVPVLGWLDDIGVVGLALFHLGRVTKRYQEADAKLDANVVDTVGYEVA